jgi:hypothetical protein
MPTFTQIGTGQVVGAGGAASIDFTSIPSTYTDLCLLFSLRDNFASVSVNAGLKINTNTSNISGRVIFGTGSAANSTTITNSIAYTVGTSGTANTFASSQLYIPNYAGSTQKSFSAESVAESNTTTVYMQMVAGLWADTSVINSLILYPLNGTLFTQYSSAYLYGVSNA